MQMSSKCSQYYVPVIFFIFYFFFSKFLFSVFSVGMMETHFSAVLNVTTQSLTHGKWWPPWQHSGVMLVFVYYEKSDPSWDALEEKKKLVGQLDFKNMPLSQSHKQRCLFASVQVGLLRRNGKIMSCLPLWTVYSPLRLGYRDSALLW